VRAGQYKTHAWLTVRFPSRDPRRDPPDPDNNVAGRAGSAFDDYEAPGRLMVR